MLVPIICADPDVTKQSDKKNITTNQLLFSAVIWFCWFWCAEKICRTAAHQSLFVIFNWTLVIDPFIYVAGKQPNMRWPFLSAPALAASSSSSWPVNRSPAHAHHRTSHFFDFNFQLNPFGPSQLWPWQLTKHRAHDIRAMCMLRTTTGHFQPTIQIFCFVYTYECWCWTVCVGAITQPISFGE